MKRPVPETYPISQPFGVPAQVYTDLGYLGHHGLDFATPIGTPVLAAAPWECHTVRHADPTAGNFVVLQHPNGLLTRYLHLSQIDVGVGDTGPEGHPIGLTGDTGLVTGPHLHFEVIDPAMDNGYKGRLDPELFLEDDVDKAEIEHALGVIWGWAEVLEKPPGLKRRAQQRQAAKELKDAVMMLIQKTVVVQ